MCFPKAVKTILFRALVPKFGGVVEEREYEARVYAEPLRNYRQRWSAGDSWEFVSSAKKEGLELCEPFGKDERYVFLYSGVCAAFKDEAALRKFYEWNMRAEILEWIEVE